MTNTDSNTLAQGTRVRVPAEASATRYYVLGYEGDTVRLVPTNTNARDFVCERNVNHRPAAAIAEDPKVVKTRLIGAWVAFEAARA